MGWGTLIEYIKFLETALEVTPMADISSPAALSVASASVVASVRPCSFWIGLTPR